MLRAGSLFRVAVVSPRLGRPFIGDLGQIAVMLGIELSPQSFRSKECDDHRICVHTAHENADDLAVLVPMRDRLGGRQRKALTDGRFNGRTGGGDEIAELVRGTNNKRPDRTRSQLHQMNRNDSPGALDTELFEESRRHDRARGNVRVWVQKSATDDADSNDREASAKDLACPPAERAASHSTQVSNDLRYRHGIGREVELRLEKGWVKILRAMGLGENVSYIVRPEGHECYSP